jgi:hypothetical protein
MNVRFLRVLGIRSRGPVVQAKVDDLLVRWQPRTGWDCECLTEADEDACDHVEAVVTLLDPRVLGHQA